MRKMIFIFLVVIALIVSECFVLYTNSKLKEEISIKNNFLENLTEHYYASETQISSIIVDAGKIIDGTIIANDTAGNTFSLADISKQLDGNNILICRYSDRMCHQCVEHTMSVFTDNKDSLKIQNIVFLADNPNRRNLKLNFSEYGLQGCKIFNCQNLGICADSADFPYILVVDKDLRVLSVYFPTKSTHGTDYDYKHVKMMYDCMVADD